MAKGSFRCPVIHIPNFVPDGNPDGMLAPESSYYLYAGVLEGHKGIGVLSQAMLDYGGSRRFVLVGRGSRERELQQLAERIGSRVELRSWVSQPVLSSLYSRASAFLMPSIWFENSPLAAIEALSWGVPLLTTSRGGVSELLHDGSAGYSFEPNPAGLLGALRVLEGLEDRKSLRRAARRAYEDHHRPATYLLRYLSIVRALGGGETPTDGVGGGGIPSSPVAGPTQGG
jgi:glycosyltransferase involved in cell wall biosynthesis